jgi:D-xylose transport system permease protein
VSTGITTSTPISSPDPDTGPPYVRVQQPTVRSHLKDYLGRIRGGDIGSLPAALGLVGLCIIFSVARPTFFSAGNFANLFQQGAQVTLIAMGMVFVLLLGEIDLSAGYASGVGAAVLAILLSDHGWPWYAAIAGALATGLVIGFVLGVLVSKVGIPSFVVTLAAFLGFQGLLLLLLKGGTTQSVRDETVIAIANSNMSVRLSWALAIGALVAYAVAQLARLRGRAVRALVSDPLGIVLARIVGVAALVLAAVAVLTAERSNNPFLISVRGVPIVVPLVAALLVVWMFVLQRTTFGRHVYAVGGNTEAARRAGIDVDRIRISVFMIGSFMAAVGGIVAASRANSVDPNTGGSNVLLYAVGAAVIGGTSLFGGKGRIIDAVIGGAVIAVIDNGMGLMGFSSGQKFIFTGVVLLVAASIDAVSRRRASATGNG